GPGCLDAGGPHHGGLAGVVARRIPGLHTHLTGRRRHTEVRLTLGEGVCVGGPRHVDGALDLVGTHIKDADPVRVRMGHRVPGGDGIRPVEIHRQPRHVRRDDGRDLDGPLRRSVKRRTHAVVRLTDDPHHVFTGFGQYDVVARSLDQCATLPRGIAYFTPVHDSPGVVGGDWLRPANTD